jgi:hypothetical protein
MLSNKELLIVLRRQITVERDQEAAIDKTTDRNRRVDRDRLFGYLCIKVSSRKVGAEDGKKPLVKME